MGGLEFWIGLGLWAATMIFARKSLVWGLFRFLDHQEWRVYVGPVLLLSLFWGVMYWTFLNISTRYEGTLLAAGVLLSVVALTGMVERMRPQQSDERNNVLDTFFYGFRPTWGLMGFLLGTMILLGVFSFQILLVCVLFGLLIMVIVFIPFSKLETEFQGYEN